MSKKHNCEFYHSKIKKKKHFPQKIYKLSKTNLSQFVYFFRELEEIFFRYFGPFCFLNLLHYFLLPREASSRKREGGRTAICMMHESGSGVNYHMYHFLGIQHEKVQLFYDLLMLQSRTRLVYMSSSFGLLAPDQRDLPQAEKVHSILA